MARLTNDDGQWIILMGLIISISIFILAIIVNQSVLVGQTTAESVLDFPKADIQDLRSEIFRARDRVPDPVDRQKVIDDITNLSLEKKSAVVQIVESPDTLTISYNNGVTRYYEIVQI